MSEPHESSATSAGRSISPALTTSRRLDTAALERLLSHIAEGTDATEGRTGSEYLLFTCRQTPCAVPLHQLREVLPTLPRTVTLPFSPPWLLGIFPLRTELLGLVDPAPALFSDLSAEGATPSPTTALVVGEGDTLLALAVTSVGDIARVQPEEIVPNSSPGGPPVAVSYARARYVPPGGGPAYAIVDLPRLLGDLLAALTEGATHG